MSLALRRTLSEHGSIYYSHLLPLLNPTWWIYSNWEGFSRILLGLNSLIDHKRQVTGKTKVLTTTTAGPKASITHIIFLMATICPSIGNLSGEVTRPQSWGVWGPHSKVFSGCGYYVYSFTIKVIGQGSVKKRTGVASGFYNYSFIFNCNIWVIWFSLSMRAILAAKMVAFFLSAGGRAWGSSCNWVPAMI